MYTVYFVYPLVCFLGSLVYVIDNGVSVMHRLVGSFNIVDTRSVIHMSLLV